MKNNNNLSRGIPYITQYYNKIVLNNLTLSDYKIKWTEGDQVIEKAWQKGDVHWHDAIEHAVENIGNADASYFVVTRKEKVLPDAGDYAITQDASQLDSEHASSIFENEYVRLIEVKLAAGESQPMHHGIHRLIYSLTSYQIEYTSDQMDTKKLKTLKKA